MASAQDCELVERLQRPGMHPRVRFEISPDIVVSLRTINHQVANAPRPTGLRQASVLQLDYTPGRYC
jgi:hypothetical protein